MTDQAVYVRFTRIDPTTSSATGTKLIATRGYNGPKIADLRFERILSGKEERELDAAVRRGAWIE